MSTQDAVAPALPAALLDNSDAEHLVPVFPMAAPPPIALAAGLLIAVIFTGIVTVQLFAYSKQFWKDHRAVVVILNIVFCYNIVSLALLGEAVYQSLVTKFSFEDIDARTIPRQMIGRAAMSYTMALLSTSSEHNTFDYFAYLVTTRGDSVEFQIPSPVPEDSS
ncbi:hypothetical protein DL93DRAFT_499066 [Clavulina sp. PMI_390]|nr:hypothetical protein DL93DRAFT_499066 [Clavulina sp. PMI_390]